MDPLPEVTVGGHAEDIAMSDEYEEGGWDDSDDEDDNQKMYGMYQALPVEGEPDWSEAEPSTAEEYLRRVQYERARCPGIVRVEVDPDKLAPAMEHQQQEQQSQASSSHAEQQRPRRARGALPPQEDIQDAPAWAQPSTAWLQDFVSSFEALRIQLQEAAETQPASAEDWPSLPEPGDVAAWERHCFSSSAEPSSDMPGIGSSSTDTWTHGRQSTMLGISPHIYGTVMQLDTVGVAELFERHVEQLLQQSTKGMDPLRGQWLFALAARMEKPLLPDTLAALRALLRHCARLRADLTKGVDSSQLPLLSVLIGAAGAYYGQDEQLCKLASPDFQALA